MSGQEMKGSRNNTARRQAILRLLHQNGRALVDDLAFHFETTPQTIRKDLNALAHGGRVMRFHGGASLLAGTEYIGFEIRKKMARVEKEQIGQAAARHIPSNAAILVNAGTTTAAAARYLSDHSGLQIVVDSVQVANEIRGHLGIDVIVPGGFVRASDGAILGDTAVDFIRQFRADVALIGVAAIAADGTLLDYDLREAALARAMVENARNVVLLADASKFERVAPVKIGHLSQVRTLITDVGHSPELEALCLQNDVGMIVASSSAGRLRRAETSDDP